MKKLILLSGLALLVYSSCSKSDDDYIAPPKDTTDTTIVIPPADTTVSIAYSDTVDLSGLPEISFPIAVDESYYQAVATNYQALLAQYNTTANKIVSVQLKSLNLKIVSNFQQDFDFVDSVSIYVYDNNLPEKLIANKVPVPKNQSSVNMNVIANQNLKPYFLQDSLRLRIRGSLNATPTSGIIITTPTFEVKANY